MQASLVCASTGLLALLHPVAAPLSYISGAALSLFTLRYGVQEGLLVTLITAVATAVLGQLALGSVLPAFVFALVLWLPLWMMAAGLYYTGRLAVSLEIAALLGLCGIVLAYLWLGDPVQWWESVLALVRPAWEQAAVSDQSREEIAHLLDILPGYMTALLASALTLTLVLNLFLARWWQASVFHPGGFASDFQGLRLDRRGVWLVLTFLVLSLATGNLLGAMARDGLWVIVTAYALAGLGLVHAVVARTKMHVAWLWALYVLLAFVPVHGGLVLALAGLTDSWFDLRRYVAQSPPPDKSAS